MSPGRDGNGSQRARDGYITDPPGAAVDDGYWESLLQEGEVASRNYPPPWLQETESPATIKPDGRQYSDDPEIELSDWQRAGRLLEEKECCRVSSTGFNRGGLLVKFGELTGFVPSSHLVGFPTYSDPFEREDALIGRVGQTIRLRVIEIDRSRNRLILSERAALESERSEQVFARLKPGDVVSGRVSNLRRFGAFVDLGGYEGLIHISEMSWGRVNSPADVVQPGDDVQVYVLDISPEARKIQLSLKRLRQDPWKDVNDRYQVGQLVQGEVTNVVSFGAFACLEEGIEGLIHISELAEGSFLHPRNVVREGDWVEALVINVDPVNRRIGLSMRQAKLPHEDAPAGALQADPTPSDNQ